MSLIKFIDWLQMHDESSASDRKKIGILRGNYPKCTDAEMLGGHSTFPWMKQYKDGTAFKKTKKSKKKSKKKG
jgi:hypothetical protein